MSAAEIELGRVEARRVGRDPALWAAIALTAWWTWNTRADSLHEHTYLLLTGYSLLVPGFVVVSHTIVAVLRSRSAGADELLSVVPVGPDRRTLGHGVSTLAGLFGTVAIAAIYVALRPGPVLGPADGELPASTVLPRPNLAQLLQGPVAVMAVAAFAIALVRWIPSRLVVGPLAFFVPFQGLVLGLWYARASSRVDWLFPLRSGVVHGSWIGCGDHDLSCELPVSGIDGVTPWWHLGYLAALATFFVAIAVLRHRRDQTVWLTCVVTFAAAAALAIIQLVVAADYAAPVAS